MLQGQISIADLGLPDGKMCREPLAVTKERTSEPLSKPLQVFPATGYQFLDLRNGIMPDAWLAMDGVLPGGCTTLNTGAFPNVARESTLSQILQANAPEKYYLSARACEGILRRAERRGKELPPMLKEALEEVVSLNQ